MSVGTTSAMSPDDSVGDRLALGTAQFGMNYGVANQSGQVSRHEVSDILALARAHGVHTLDTAMDYGDSEACIGACGSTGFNIVTKLSGMPDDVPDVEAWVRDKMDASLARLKVTSVRGLLLHRPHQLTESRGPALARALMRLKADGLVEKVGVSIYSPSELGSVLQAGPVDVVQAPFNLIDRRLLTSGWLDKLHDSGVEIHVRSAFLQGLMLMPRANIPQKFNRWDTVWDTWHEWLRHHNCSAAQACIGFAKAHPQIDKIVVGVDSPAHFQQLIVASRAAPLMDWPATAVEDEALINPSKWSGS